MKAVVFTLGCKVNQYESDLLLQELKERGFQTSSALSYADLYIINTCAITAEAERKSRQTIKRCNRYNPSARIYIWGCAGQHNPTSFQRPNVVCIYGAKDKHKILDIIDKDYGISHPNDGERTYLELKNTALKDTEPILKNTEPILKSTERTRAYVKIQDGCNNFCNYCIIPHLRGNSRSADLNKVIKEIKSLSKTHKEVVITGINLMLFGKDTNTSLTELFKALADIDIRLRLGSFYAEGVTTELLDTLFSLKHFSPHFHLSLQSGDNQVLKSMNRHYTTEEFQKKVDLIRTYDNNVALTTDLIIGYPTEQEQNFNNTKQFIKDISFSDIHIFPFSARQGTPASRLKLIPQPIIKERISQMLNIKKDLQLKYLNANIKVVQKVLFEEKKNGINRGYSDRYIKIYAKTDEELAEIMPTEIYKDGLKGEVINEK